MPGKIKDQNAILKKLGIKQLNPMQEEAEAVIRGYTEIVLLSPTGTGKTLAFLLPIIAELDQQCKDVQVLVLVPSRELAIQIGQVVQDMGTGYKTNTVYGGQSFSTDRVNLKHRPAILIGTPGRVADHLRRNTFPVDSIRTLVLDEFDKSLHVGFENEMREIINTLPELSKKILTSATQAVAIPKFVGLKTPRVINHLKAHTSQLKIKTVISPSKDKLETLLKTIHHIGNEPGIVFCNFKESIERVSAFLDEHKVDHVCFSGGMEQKDRERALIKFRNGTQRLIVATDLAARGIDVPEIKFIIHYQLPLKEEEFTHRNGRTARMFNDGTAYVLKWEKEELPEFIKGTEVEKLKKAQTTVREEWETIYINGGKRDKISKGDIAGLFFKQGKLTKEQLGTIELKQDCAFVAVHASEAKNLIKLLDNTKLKNRKIKVSLLT
ncbi:MAG TPA: DEAD/DEAH box helicase [Bacteroidia bacterium]